MEDIILKIYKEYCAYVVKGGKEDIDEEQRLDNAHRTINAHLNGESTSKSGWEDCVYVFKYHLLELEYQESDIKELSLGLFSSDLSVSQRIEQLEKYDQMQGDIKQNILKTCEYISFCENKI